MLLKHYLDRGVSKAELSRRFGVSRRTIHEWVVTGQLDRDLSSGGSRYSPRPPVPHKLDRYTGIIDSRLEEFPGLSAQRLFDEVGAAGYAGGYGRVRDYVQAVRPRELPEPVVRFETPAGHQGQVDFATFTLPWGRRYALVVVLSHSRLLWLCFYPRQTMAVLTGGLETAFERFGGVPKELLFDQMRAVVLSDRTVADVWADEKPRLLPLPAHPFETDLVRVVRSGKTPYVRFDRNLYSIPHTHVRKPLTLLASNTRVRILDQQTQLASHRRTYDTGQTVEDPAHLEGLLAATRQANVHTVRDRLRAAVPATTALFERLAERGEAMRPHATRLLALLDDYGAQELAAAVDDALQRDALGAGSITHILETRRRRRGLKPPLRLTLPDRPGLRDLDVRPLHFMVLRRPSDNTTPTTHRVPLNDLATEILTELRERVETDGFVSPYVLAGARSPKRRAAACHGMGLKDFRGHDLRRTAASRMASAGVPRLVIGKVLNHVERGVTAVYDRHSYDEEKSRALKTWAASLSAILAQGSGAASF